MWSWPTKLRNECELDLLTFSINVNFIYYTAESMLSWPTKLYNECGIDPQKLS